MAYVRHPIPASKDSHGTVIVGDHLKIEDDGKISVDVDSIISHGEWVPKLISSSKGGMITVKIHHALYTIVGSLVHALFDIEVQQIDSGDSSSYIMLEGIPLMSVNSKGYSGSLIVTNFQNLDSSATSITGSVIPGSYACDLWYGTKNVTTLEKLEYGDIKKKTRLQGIVIYTAGA